MLSFLLPLLASPVQADNFQTWCGKQYEVGAPRTPPSSESRFSYPSSGDQKLLDFKCSTASSIYLPGDDALDPPAIILDAAVAYDYGKPLFGNEGEYLTVSVSLDNSTTVLKDIQVPIGSYGMLANFTLSDLGLSPSTDPASMTCTAQYGNATYTDTTELMYLPENPYNGSSVKIDRKTGYLKVQYEAGQEWKQVLPFGFYDSINTTEINGQGFSDPNGEPIPMPLQADARGEFTYSNKEKLQMMSRLNYTMVHPVPPGNSYRLNGNETAIYEYFDEAERLGLGVMYDMRHSFANLTLVEPQIEEFRSRKGLLVWYTGDEPDGPSTPLNTTKDTRDLIHSVDPYHPVALVLNCADYHWTEFSSGADILLADPYPIALNGAYSKRWSTPITYDYGVSGCDGCMGSFYDITNRIDDWKNRARLSGKARDMPLWIVPQMFADHGDEFWWRAPEGDEGAVQVVLGWNHGVTGHCGWYFSTAGVDVLYNASSVATQLRAQTSFVIDAVDTRRKVSTSVPYDGENGLDVAAWTRTRGDGVQETLVLAAQVFYNFAGSPTGTIDFELIGLNGTVKEILFGGVNMTDAGTPMFSMERTSVAGVILEG